MVGQMRGGAWAALAIAAAIWHGADSALADGLDWSRAHLNTISQQPTADSMTPMIDPGAIASWRALAAQVRASQPAWSSPLITTTGMLEQRFRFDASQQHAGNGADTTVLDGGRGLDLIVSNSNEIQIAAPPYNVRNTPTGKGALTGFGDWAFVRVKQQLAASPASGGDYFRDGVAAGASAHWDRATDQSCVDVHSDFGVRQRLGRFRYSGHDCGCPA